MNPATASAPPVRKSRVSGRSLSTVIPISFRESTFRSRTDRIIRPTARRWYSSDFSMPIVRAQSSQRAPSPPKSHS